LDCVDPNVSDRSSIAHPNGDDPEVCNAYLNDPARRCEPMGKIKDVAVNFIDQLFFPYDRVAVVAFTEQTAGGSRNVTNPVLPFNDDQGDVRNAILGLKSLQLPRCPDTSYPGSCLVFDASDNYIGQPCMPKTAGNGDPSGCGSSNFGGGLTLAGNQFAEARQESFWVVIALIGGPTNVTVIPCQQVIMRLLTIQILLIGLLTTGILKPAIMSTPSHTLQILNTMPMIMRVMPQIILPHLKLDRAQSYLRSVWALIAAITQAPTLHLRNILVNTWLSMQEMIQRQSPLLSLIMGYTSILKTPAVWKVFSTKLPKTSLPEFLNK
jgi:hypothetical protein